MAIPFAAIVALAQLGIGAYGMFRKRPKAPSGGGISPELEQQMLTSLKRRIGERRDLSLGATRERAAQRGFYRSGQLPQLEQGIERSADQQYSEALTEYELAKAQREASLRELIWSKGMEEWGAGQKAGGEALGGGFDALMAFLEQKYGGGFGGRSGAGGLGVKNPYRWKTGYGGGAGR